MTAFPYLMSLLIPATLWSALHLQQKGFPFWWAITPVVVLILHPFLDAITSENRSDSKSESKIFSILLWLQIPLLYSLTFFVLSRAEGFGGWGLLDLAVGLGAANGAVGITVAHELIHRTNAKERALGVSLLALVNYMHYRIEHVFGHHKYVATPEDPATGRRNESIYAFWFRCIPASFFSAWGFECQRIASRKLPWYSVKNRMLQYGVVQLVLAVLVTLFFGEKALLVFWGQSAVAILFLELINYVEHYGLERGRLPNGLYAPATAAHSWDTNRRLTNWILFNLGRHAHHHLRPTQPYQKLEALEESPKLPQGYSGLLMLVLIPPLWHRVMGKRIDQHTASALTSG